MAMIKCVECGEEISSKAKKCPSCGYALKRKNKLKIVTVQTTATQR